MSRQSAAALSVVPRLPSSRPKEPPDLSGAELAIWRDVVDSKPGDWFGPDTLPVLKEYVRAAVTCDVLDGKVKAAMEEGAVGLVEKLLNMRDKESRRMVSCATKLRLTQQSRYTPGAAATADRKAAGKRPWSA